MVRFPNWFVCAHRKGLPVCPSVCQFVVSVIRKRKSSINSKSIFVLVTIIEFDNLTFLDLSLVLKMKGYILKRIISSVLGFLHYIFLSHPINIGSSQVKVQGFLQSMSPVQNKLFLPKAPHNIALKPVLNFKPKLWVQWTLTTSQLLNSFSFMVSRHARGDAQEECYFSMVFSPRRHTIESVLGKSLSFDLTHDRK